MSKTITVMAFLLLFPLSLLSQVPSSEADELAATSDVIVVGKVGKLVSEWNENRSRIQTRISIAVDETIKGSQASGPVEVIIPGGEVDGVGEWYSHTTRFEKDENIVLFATKDARGRLGVTGGDHGKFSITKDPSTGIRMIPRIGSLDSFTTRIRQSLAIQQSRSKRK